METKKEKDDVLKKHIDKLVKPKFEKVAEEISKNPMRVVSGVKPPTKYCLYSPHNFRRYFDFSKTNFNPKNPGKSAVVEYRILNKTEHSYNDFLECRIIIKKTQVEVINKKEAKRWFRIELGDIDNIKFQIKQIIIKKENECIDALKEFIKQYGGCSDFNILNRSSEDKIEDEDVVNLLPIKQRFHSPPVKKVYNEKNVEFSDPVFASNYLRTRAIEDIAPQISIELKGINIELQGELKPVLKALTEQITVHLDVQRNTLKSQKETQKTMKDIRDFIVKKPTKKPRYRRISPNVESFLNRLQKGDIIV